MAQFDVIFNDPVNEFIAGFSEIVNEFSAQFNSDQSFAAYMDSTIKILPDPYQGDYFVTPIVEDDIILSTKNKNMAQDLTVGKIPIYEMENDKGGTTVYIAMEV